MKRSVVYKQGREMRVTYRLFAATFLAAIICSIYWSPAQTPTAEESPQQPAGGFVPGQKRPPIDPAVIARGKTLYGINCQGCHGPDLRGGDMGGPNLLRSQVALTDLNGELIVPIIQGSRRSMGMPAIPLSLDDSKIVAAYVRSVVVTIGRAGAPPNEQQPVNIVVGNAGDGAAYFARTCAGCHSPEGDLRGIATRVTDPKQLQNEWVTGGAYRKKNEAPSATVTVTLPSGESVQGQLVRIDDFLVTLKSSDGVMRTFTRKGTSPKIVIVDPLKGHKDLLPTYTDKEIHDVTAYLVTLK
jgi:cytochrome c oxidase cbb3-type subunit III